TPDQKHLCCVVASDADVSAENGIWIGRPSDGDWWHVPESDTLGQGELSSKLEQLRATQPAWTKDGSRFAFVSGVPANGPNEPARHFLRLGTLNDRKVELLAERHEPFRDLHWAPDGERLGVVSGGETGSLHVIRRGQRVSEPLNNRPVRRFA